MATDGSKPVEMKIADFTASGVVMGMYNYDESIRNGMVLPARRRPALSSWHCAHEKSSWPMRWRYKRAPCSTKGARRASAGRDELR